MALLGLALVVLLVALLVRPYRAPPRLLGSDGEPRPYVQAVVERIRAAHQRIDLVMFSSWMEDGGDPPDLVAELAAAAARGIAVTVCLDYDERETGSEDRNGPVARWLAARGVRVLRDEGDRRTHAKVLVVDERWVVLGSHNWTRTGIHRNRELSLLLDDPALAAEILAWTRTIPGWPTASAGAPTAPH